MPSHGYCAHGGSRSPSSRSRKPGTKNSRVSVVSFTRPNRNRMGSVGEPIPGVTVRMLNPASPAQLLDLVRSGRAEAGITEDDRSLAGLSTVALARQSLVAVLPPASGPTGSGTAGSGPMTPDELARQPLIVTPPGTSLRTLVDRFVGAAAGSAVPPALRVAVETDQRDMLVPLVLRGAGAAVLPPALAADAAAEGAEVRPLDPPLERRIVLVHRPDGLAPAAATFVNEAVVSQA